ncbi:MAG: ComF family protein [Patescibacteria group bacterium]
MGILDLIFPKNCLKCKKEGKYICNDCIQKVRLARSVCSYCGVYSFFGKTHENCKRKYSLDGVYSIWKYGGVVRKAIIALKYKFANEISKEIAKASVFEIKHNSYFKIHNSFVLVPVPLHTKRENWRGYNQAEEIGNLIVKDFNWKFIPDLLIRKVSTKPQVGLKGEERRQNVKDIFEINQNYRSLATDHRTLIIFDDVYTTGSTLKEAGKVLKKSGFSNVWGLTISR